MITLQYIPIDIIQWVYKKSNNNASWIYCKVPKGHLVGGDLILRFLLGVNDLPLE
jgi:hypothetical protein